MGSPIPEHGASRSADDSSQPAQQYTSRAAPGIVRRVVPSLVVFACLGAIGYWGHTTGWTLPKFSTLMGQNATPAAEWCAEHNVPEAACIECKPNLWPRQPEYGWCAEHGVSQCPLEHPDIVQLHSPPTILPSDFEQARRALSLRPRPENNSRCMLHQHRIQFASPAAIDKAGVDIAVVARRPMVEAVTANGDLSYEQTRMAHLSSRVAGAVRQVRYKVGDRVQRGDVLALVESGEVGRAKSELLQALAQERLKSSVVERIRPLASDASIAPRQMREAEAELEAAQIRLLAAGQALVNLGLPQLSDKQLKLDIAELSEQVRFLGVPVDMVRQLDSVTASSNLLPLHSPLDGLIVESHLVAGEAVSELTTLAVVADVRRMWLTLHVRQDDARYLELGQKVLFRPDGARDTANREGLLTWISTQVDDETRTVRVRAELPNDDGQLRANTFGTARIVLREEPAAIVVPTEAVHRDADCSVVFVRDKDYFSPDAPKFFHVRKVRTGVKEDGVTEIIVGLMPGEIVAAKNSGVLESQLLKGNLGAGCGCADGH